MGFLSFFEAIIAERRWGFICGRHYFTLVLGVICEYFVELVLEYL
jgi:hypothetical protein